VAERQRQRADDLTSALIDIHDEDPEAFTLDEIASILFSLSFAGHETTNYLIGNLMRRLLEDAARWERVVADPAAIPASVEETLRFDPSVCVWRRVTTKPASVGGVELPAGVKLFLWLAAAGRDASVFPEPDAFDLDRDNARRHLAFGRGIHYCLGASLGSSRPSWRWRSSRGGSRGWRSWRDRSCASTGTSRSGGRRSFGCGLRPRFVRGRLWRCAALTASPRGSGPGAARPLAVVLGGG
jgi:hypothetical protein